MLDGGNFTDKISLKMKCKFFSALKKNIRINNKRVVLEPFKLFNRLAIVLQRQLTVHESLRYELTILPSNFFDSNQPMRTSKKQKLCLHLKQMAPTCDRTCTRTAIIDGGWLVHQISWESSCSN